MATNQIVNKKVVIVNSRQISHKVGLILQMLDLVSLARLAGCEW